MPAVSVLVATYNHAPYLEESIGSVLNQSFQDFEIVVVNDGSTDNSVEVLAGFTDPRIKVIHLPGNKGVNHALNVALENSSGELVCPLDSDDTFHPEKLEKQKAVLAAMPDIGAVYSLARMMDERGVDIVDHPFEKKFLSQNRPRHRWLEFMFNVGGFLCSHSVMLRRSCFEKTGVFDPRFGKIPDIEFQVRLLLHEEIFILPEKLLNYRRRDGEKNNSAKTQEGYVQSRLEILASYRNFYTITDVEELTKVFPFLLQQHPEILTLKDQFSPGMCHFLLAMLSLTIGSAPVRLLAMETLYRLMEDPREQKNLEKFFNFSYPQLFAVAKTQDVFQYFGVMRPDWEKEG